jgi:hypothetical protein
MTREETVQLVAYISEACPQQAMGEFTPDVWHDFLGHLSLDNARHAAMSVIWRQPFVSPSEIIAEAERKRREHPSSRTVAEAIGQSSLRQLTAAPASPPTDEYKSARAEMEAKQRERNEALYVADRTTARRAQDWIDYKLSGKLPPNTPPLGGPVPSQFVILPDDPPELVMHLRRQAAAASVGERDDEYPPPPDEPR